MSGEPENADRRGAGPRRRAGTRRRAVPRRRQQSRLPRVLRAARRAADDGRTADERPPRVHEHALQAPLRLQAAGRCRRVGHAARAPQGDRRRVQSRPPLDARSAARAVPALPPDRRGVRLPEPRVRGVGGGRRDRHAGDAGGRRGREDVRGLDRPGRVPARVRERLPDDDATRRRGRAGLHARTGRGPLRHPAVPDPGLHRPEGGHERQHPRHPGDRRQDGRPARRAVRLARGGRRARRRAVACALEGDRRERRAGGCFEAPRDDAARPRPRRRLRNPRAAAAGPLRAEGDLQAVRVPGAPEPRRHPRRGAAGGRAPRDRDRVGSLARGRPCRGPRPDRRGRRRRAPRSCHGARGDRRREKPW